MNGLIVAFYVWAAAVAVSVVFKIVAYFCGDVYLWIWRHFPGLRKGDLRDDHPDFFRKDLRGGDGEE